MEITRQNEFTVAVIKGVVNARNVDELSQDLLPLIQPGGKLVLDVTGVEFMSSAGLRLLLQLQRASASAKGALILTGLSEDVSETMRITGFLEHFSCYPTVAEAMASS